jgi:hypothetical protein
LRRKQELESKFRDHELGYARPSDHALSEEEARSLITGTPTALRTLSGNLNRVLDPATTEAAFGPPGQPGDPDRIEHIATRLIEIYEAFLDWSARLRAAAVPERFERAAQLASALADNPVHEIRSFVDQTVAEFDRAPALLREKRDEPVQIRQTLTLTIDDQVLKKFNKEVKRLP